MRVALNFTYVMFATLLARMQPDIDAVIIEDFEISLDAFIGKNRVKIDKLS